MAQTRWEEKAGAEAFRKLLLDKREQLLRALGMKFETLAEMGRLADEDQAQVSHDEFVSVRLNRLGYTQLRLVEEALDRLRTGDYGTCLACEESIAPKRLLAVPWARYCVECQEKIGTEATEDLDPVRQAP